MKGIIRMIEHDFRNFFRYKWWLVGLISMNLADLFVSALVYNNILRTGVKAGIGGSYFNFFAPGLAVTGLFASAFMIGREVNMERRREVHHYLLSLPMTRLELAIGRVLSGGLRGMMYMSPLLLTCFIFVGFPTIWQLLLILAVLFLLAVGISGLSISIAVSTPSLETFITARGAVYYVLFFCSTVFYPLAVIQTAGPALADLARANPLSGASDMIRSILLPSAPSSSSFSYLSILYIAAFSAIFTFTAAFAYMKILERK